MQLRPFTRHFLEESGINRDGAAEAFPRRAEDGVLALRSAKRAFWVKRRDDRTCESFRRKVPPSSGGTPLYLFVECTKITIPRRVKWYLADG